MNKRAEVVATVDVSRTGQSVGLGRSNALAVAALLVSVAGLVWLSGADFRDACLTVGVVGVEAVGGVLLWLLLLRRTAPSLPEVVGVGLALGTMLATASSQLLRTTTASSIAWCLPTLVLLGVVLVLGTGRELGLRVEPIGWRGLTGMLVAAAALFVVLVPWFVGNPLGGVEWRTMFVDVPFFESLANSLHRLGSGDSMYAAGLPVRYHWLAYAWVGSTTAASGADHFVVLTRVLPLVAGLGTVATCWAMAARLAKGWIAPVLACVLVLLGNDVGTGFGRVIWPESPSVMVSGLWLAALAMVISRQFRGQVRGSMLVLCVGAFMVMGSKSSAGAVLSVGVIGTVVALRRNLNKTIIFGDVIAVVVGSVAAFVLLVVGAWGLTSDLSPGATAVFYAFVPHGTFGWLIAGSLAVTLAMASQWSGAAVLWGKVSFRRRPELWLATFAGVVALAAGLALDMFFASQAQFALSATVLLIPLSAAGFTIAVWAGDTRRLDLAWLLIAGIASGLLGTAAAQLLPMGWRWLGPLIPLLAAVAAGSALRMGRQSTVGSCASFMLGAGAIVLVTASVAAGVVVTAHKYDLAISTPSATPGSKWAFDGDDVAAAAWVRDKVPEGDLMATNRWCSTTTMNENCSQSWWLTSALAERRQLVEGTVSWFAPEPATPWAGVRQDAVRSFVTAPDQANWSALSDSGVKWVWVDTRLQTTSTWEPWASVAYKSGRVAILRLNADPMAQAMAVPVA